MTNNLDDLKCRGGLTEGRAHNLRATAVRDLFWGGAIKGSYQRNAHPENSLCGPSDNPKH